MNIEWRPARHLKFKTDLKINHRDHPQKAEKLINWDTDLSQKNVVFSFTWPLEIPYK